MSNTRCMGHGFKRIDRLPQGWIANELIYRVPLHQVHKPRPPRRCFPLGQIRNILFRGGPDIPWTVFYFLPYLRLGWDLKPTYLAGFTVLAGFTADLGSSGNGKGKRVHILHVLTIIPHVKAHGPNSNCNSEEGNRFSKKCANISCCCFANSVSYPGTRNLNSLAYKNLFASEGYLAGKLEFVVSEFFSNFRGFLFRVMGFLGEPFIARS